MKRVITTVGTSLITNYLENNNDIQSHYNSIQNKPYSKYNEEKKRVEKIKKSLLNFAKNSNDSCAELTSINKLQEKYGEIVVYLIATDTIESVLVCELLSEILENIKFNPQHDVISDLQIEKYELFKEGLSNLINRLYGIASNYYDDLVLNMTGGYKAVIPYLTIFGQVNSIPLYYIFENSNSLISIPKIPISIEEELFDKYWKEFQQLSKDEIIEKNTLSYQFLTEIESLLEIDDSLVSLNPLGNILWKRYRDKFFIFYAPQNILEVIEKQSDISRILETKFWQETRESKTEQKDGHLVYDDGKNVNRIFYFVEDDAIYIYKTFNSNHDEYEKYINNAQVDKNKIKENAQVKKIEKRIDNV